MYNKERNSFFPGPVQLCAVNLVSIGGAAGCLLPRGHCGVDDASRHQSVPSPDLISKLRGKVGEECECSLVVLLVLLLLNLFKGRMLVTDRTGTIGNAHSSQCFEYVIWESSSGQIGCPVRGKLRE